MCDQLVASFEPCLGLKIERKNSSQYCGGLGMEDQGVQSP